MASLLNPSRTSSHNNNNSFKYKLDCNARLNPEHPDTIEWLELLELINHNSPDYKIFIGLLNKVNNIVIKVGSLKLENEYKIGSLLSTINLATFLEYHCIFQCLDDIKLINSRTKSLCKTNGNNIYVLVMPYVKEGQIDKWKWNRNNFNTLKNILKHIIMSLLYSHIQIGFIHRDLHLGNILLKKTKKKNISYGDLGTLEIIGDLIPIIMDYDRSTISSNQPKLVYNDIKRVLSLISTEINCNINVMKIISVLMKFISDREPISLSVCNILCKNIDELEIAYMVAELS